MLKEKIVEDMKMAMREKDTIRLNAIRMLKSDIKNQEINLMKELDDEGVLKIVASSIKKRRESIDLFTKANRLDLADKELEEIKTIECYMPKQLTEDELKVIIKEIVASLDETSQKNFAMVMKGVTAKTSGRADGKIVSALVKEIIG